MSNYIITCSLNPVFLAKVFRVEDVDYHSFFTLVDVEDILMRWVDKSLSKQGYDLSTIRSVHLLYNTPDELSIKIHFKADFMKPLSLSLRAPDIEPLYKYVNKIASILEDGFAD